MDKEIIKLMHQGMVRLNTKCKTFENDMAKVPISSSIYRQYMDRGLAVIQQCKAQLEVHLNLDNVSLGDVNFYREFRTPFLTGSYHKGVEFYIKEIRNEEESEPILVDDEEILDMEFTIHNCMPCMQLVPQQLAGNAKKYCVSGQDVKVLLVKDVDYNTNTIYVSNIGPHCTNDEINIIVEGGVSGNEVRGDNAKDVAGMGIGLSEVKDIIDLHEPVLDTSFDISTNNKVVCTINGKEYSIFTTIISYLTQPKAADRIPFSKKFLNRIPIILLHNSIDIIANLIEATKSFRKIRFNGNEELVSTIDKFLIEINKFQDLTKMCLYMRNEFTTDNLLGNTCTINMGHHIRGLLTNICRNDYPTIKIGSEIQIEGETCPCEVYSSMFSCLYGFFDYLLCQINEDSAFDVFFDKDAISITCEEIDFSEIMVETIPEDWLKNNDYESIRLKMYSDIFRQNQYGIQLVDSHQILITYNT